MTHYRLVEDHLSAVSNLTFLIWDLITEAVGYCGQFISFLSLPFLPLGSPSLSSHSLFPLASSFPPSSPPSALTHPVSSSQGKKFIFCNK